MGFTVRPFHPFQPSRLALSLAALMMLLAATGATTAAQESPLKVYTDALEVDLVTVEVLVSDKTGQPVSGLRASDFKLLEDGKKVEISRFVEGGGEEQEQLDSQVVVFVDNRHLSRDRRDAVLEILGDVLGSRMEQSTMPVMIVAYSTTLDVRQPFTTDSTTVRSTLEALRQEPVASAELFERRRQTASFLDNNVSQLRQGLANRREGQAAFDSMFAQLEGFGRGVQEDSAQTVAALTSLVSTLGGVNGTKSLFYIGEGLAMRPLGQLLADFQLREGGKNAAYQDTVDVGAFDNRESMGIPETGRIESLGRVSQKFDLFSLDDQFSELAGRASAGRVAIYPLLVSADKRAEARREEENRAFSDLREGGDVLAERTGGAVLPTDGEIAAFVGEALGSWQSRYSLLFSPRGKADGGFHSIQVEVKGKGLQAHYRDGYVHRSFAQRFAQEAIAALMIEYGENHHGMDLEIEEQTRREDGTYDVKVLVLIPIEGIGLVENDGVHWAEARIVAVSSGPQGELSVPQLVQVPLQIPAADLETARAQNFGGYLALTLPAGKHRLALGLWDVVADRVSFLVAGVQIGPEAAQAGS